MRRRDPAARPRRIWNPRKELASGRVGSAFISTRQMRRRVRPRVALSPARAYVRARGWACSRSAMAMATSYLARVHRARDSGAAPTIYEPTFSLSVSRVSAPFLLSLYLLPSRRQLIYAFLREQPRISRGVTAFDSFLSYRLYCALSLTSSSILPSFGEVNRNYGRPFVGLAGRCARIMGAVRCTATTWKGELNTSPPPVHCTAQQFDFKTNRQCLCSAVDENIVSAKVFSKINFPPKLTSSREN